MSEVSTSVNWTDNLPRDIEQLSKLTASIEQEVYERMNQLDAKFESMTEEYPVITRYPKRISLDVGGQIFRTSIEVLTKEASLFSSMFSGRIVIDPDPFDGSYFVDRSPELFHYVLEYLRNGKINDLAKGSKKRLAAVDKQKLLKEALFYEIEGLIELLGGKKGIPDYNLVWINTFSHVTLTNDDATAERISGSGWDTYVRSEYFPSEGKYKFDLTIDQCNSDRSGFTICMSYDGNSASMTSYSSMFGVGLSGSAYGGSIMGDYNAVTSASKIRVTVDFDTKKIIWKNQNNQTMVSGTVNWPLEKGWCFVAVLYYTGNKISIGEREK